MILRSGDKEPYLMFIHQVTSSLKPELFFTAIALPLGVEKELSVWAGKKQQKLNSKNDTGHPWSSIRFYNALLTQKWQLLCVLLDSLLKFGLAICTNIYKTALHNTRATETIKFLGKSIFVWRSRANDANSEKQSVGHTSQVNSTKGSYYLSHFCTT